MDRFQIVEALQRQALIVGVIYFVVFIVSIAGLFVGIFLIDYFLKLKDKEGGRWFLCCGLATTFVSFIVMIVVLWLGATHLFNPDYCVMEYLKELQRSRQSSSQFLFP